MCRAGFGFPDQSGEGTPPVGLARALRSARSQADLDPSAQMRMPRRPSQHGAGYAEVVMLPGRAIIDDTGLSHLWLKCHQAARKRAACWSINNPDLTGLQFGLKKFEQIGPANGVDQHRAMFDWPPLKIHAIARAADMQANHARTKRLEQNLGIGRVVAEIGDNKSIGIVAAINRRERAGTIASIKPCGNSVSSLIPSSRGWTGLFPPMTAVERSRLRPTSCAMISGLKQGQVLGSSRL